jgi:hypothetical protein
MARAALAFALLAVVGLAVAVPRDEGPAGVRPATRATPAPVGARAEGWPALASALRAGPPVRLAPAPLHLPRAPQASPPCFREGGGPCIRLCTYLARAGQTLTPGCPAVAPEGCAHLISARSDCGLGSETPVPAPRRMLPPLPRRRVLPAPPHRRP